MKRNVFIGVFIAWSCMHCGNSSSPVQPAGGGGSHWYETVNIQASNQLDSSVQLFLDTLPVFCSWNIYRTTGEKESFVKRCWGQCFHDPHADPFAAASYRLELLDENGNKVKMLSVSTSALTKMVRVGLIFPDSTTILNQGEAFHFIWNRFSFPDSTVTILYNDYCSMFAKNNGDTIFSLPQLYSSCNLGIQPPNNPAYRYDCFVKRVCQPLCSESIPYPLIKDTVHVGLLCPLSWARESFTGTLGIVMANEDGSSCISITQSPNSGEYACPIPNVQPGVYFFILWSVGYGDFRYSAPFYVVR